MITNLKTLCCPLFVLLFVFLTLLCFGTPHAEAAARTVTVGVYENAPKVFTSESGRPSGIFIDIIEEIARREGWDLRYVSGTWAEGLDRLAKGEIDLMPDVAYTAERERIFSFHKTPVLTVWSQVYARRGSGIQSILDLNGKRVAALEQTIQLETFKRLTNSFGLNITLIPVPDYKTEFEMIAAGRVDAGLTNRLYGLMYARKSGLEDTPVMFDPAPFFFAARRDSSRGLPDAIDRRLSEMKNDPRSAYYAAMKRWTSEEVQFRLPAWLQVLGLVLGVVLLMSVGGSFVLRHKVNARTRELRTSEERFFKAFHATPDAIVISRASNGLLLEVNEVFLRQTGFLREEALNRTTVELNLWADPHDRERYINAVREEGKVRDMEAAFLTKSGRMLSGLVSGDRIVLADEPCVLTIIRDITERKKTEAELEKHRLHLEDMVKERTTELEAANTKLRELDRLKSLFIASMSHELRTPLNSIIGFTGILLQGLAGPLNEEQRKQLGMVKGSSQHLLDLITDIIDLSKIEAGKIQFSLSTFDLVKVASEVAESFGPAAGGKGIAIAVEGAGTLGVKSDQRRIRQVLVNLVGNAVKFTETGEVRVSVREYNGHAVIDVRDTGPGIRQEDMKKLFQFFSQITSADMPKHEGTGLGLYLSKRLMNLLGGDIRAGSEFGRGSVFTVTLPLQEREMP